MTYPDSDAQPARRNRSGLVILLVLVFAGGFGLNGLLRSWSSRATSSATPATDVPAVINPARRTPHAAPSAAIVDGSAPVAKINGEAITLRDLEDALLKKEGVEQVQDLMTRQLATTDWATLKDNDVIVATSTWRLSRVMTAAQLLRNKAGPAREDLIGIKLVEQAMKKEGVVVDQAAIAEEVKRTERRLHDSLEARKQPYVDFAAFIQQTQKMSLEEFVQQPGFRMGTALHILVQRRAKAEVPEAELKEYFAAHIERYRVQAAADISDIFIAYQTAKGADGKDTVTQAEKDRLMDVMRQLHVLIFKRQTSFERNFALFGRGFDPNADANGRLGWVNRDGTRPIKGSRAVSKRAMDEAFAVQPPYPVLIEPVAGENGIDLMLVHARRPGKEPDFAELKDRLISDIVDAEIEPRTKRLLDQMRRAANIEYLSMPELIEQRARAASLPTATAGEAPAP